MQSVIQARLEQIVKSNSLTAFYSAAKLATLAQTIATKVDFYQLAAR